MNKKLTVILTLLVILNSTLKAQTKIFTAVSILVVSTAFADEPNALRKTSGANSISVVLPQNDAIDSLKIVLRTQKEDTNKVNMLNEICSQLNKKFDYKNSIQYAKDALSLSERINFKKGEGAAYFNIGFIISRQNNYPEALKVLLTSLKIRQDIGDKPGMAQSYFWIADTYNRWEKIPEGLKNWYSALKLYEETGDKKNTAKSLQMIAGVYWEVQGDAKEALRYCLASLKIKEQIGDKEGMAQSLNTIGAVYARQGKDNEALEKYFAALKIYKELGANGPKWGLPWTYACIADIYSNQGGVALEKKDNASAKYKLNEALKNYFEALKSYEHHDGGDSETGIYTHIGYTYIKLKQFSSARSYLEKARKKAEADGRKKEAQYAFAVLSELARAQGNYKEALEYYQTSVIYRDSVENEEEKKKYIQSQMQYEFDKKEADTKAEQDKKDVLTSAEISRQKVVRNFSVAGVFAVLSFGGFAFYNFRKRKKSENQQALSNERLRISRELHDDIGSTLGSIAVYSDVAKNRSVKNENPAEALSKIGTASRELIEKMSDIVWSLNPGNETFEQMQNRMEGFAAMILTPQNIVVEFKADEELKALMLTSEQRKNIFLIFKEAIHNIIKYAECGNVLIALAKSNTGLSLIIHDDGKGFDMESTVAYNGNGIKNMKARAADMKASLNIVSGKNEGATIELSVNI